MSLLTKDKITQIFCLAADLCKEYSAEINSHKKLPADEGKKTRNRKHEMSDSEIITILMLYHFGSFKNFKHTVPNYTSFATKKLLPE